MTSQKYNNPISSLPSMHYALLRSPIHVSALYRRNAALILTALLAIGVFTTTIDRILRELTCYHATAGIDDAMQLVQRFAPLKKIVGPCEVLGYTTDLHPINEEVFFKEFAILRYVIAPAILILTLDKPRLIGNFHNPQSYADTLATHGLILARDFGNGILLLEQQGSHPCP